MSPIYEPTGSYSCILTKFCHTQKIKCFIINPSQFSNHAKALGQRVQNSNHLEALKAKNGSSCAVSNLKKNIQRLKEQEKEIIKKVKDIIASDEKLSIARISKAGSALYRGSLFLGVLSAVRYDKNFKQFFDRLISKGKHTTVAQIAVMRKMIIIAHSLYKNNKKYDKEIYKKASGGDL
ncbi:MAG: hypothetical protein L3J10_07500 [Sulfurimonas sp.]|nr:hypothetical protein [Sulfurimonas sp.]